MTSAPPPQVRRPIAALQPDSRLRPLANRGHKEAAVGPQSQVHRHLSGPQGET